MPCGDSSRFRGTSGRRQRIAESLSRPKIVDGLRVQHALYKETLLYAFPWMLAMRMQQALVSSDGIYVFNPTTHSSGKIGHISYPRNTTCVHLLYQQI